MFKKKKSVKTKSFKKRTYVEEEDDEDHVEESVSDTVKAIKRRREVLNGLQYKRGVDASALGTSRDSTKETLTTVEEDDDDSKLPSNTKRTNESQVWKERHQKAMEDYIESKLQQHEESTNTTKEMENPQQATTTTIHSKDQLFQELAATAQQLSGKTTNGETTTLQHQEVLRSGAATAMAEVILPSSSSSNARPSKSSRKMSRIPAAKTTEMPLDGRVGFAAARGIKEMKPREPSADEKAYKNFVQRQRR